jgi:NifU-like protein involved in Fe-S cluster formation
MKKVLTLAVIVGLSFASIGCGSSASSTSVATKVQTVTTTVKDK